MDKNNLNDMSDPQRKIYKQTYGDNLKSMAASMTKIIIVSSAYQILGKQHLNKFERTRKWLANIKHSDLSNTQLTAENSILKICGNHFQKKQSSKLLQANDPDNGYFHFNKFRMLRNIVKSDI